MCSAASSPSALPLWLFMSFPCIKHSVDLPWVKFKFLGIGYSNTLGLGYLLGFIFHNFISVKTLIYTYHAGLNFRMIWYNWSCICIWLLEMPKSVVINYGLWAKSRLASALISRVLLDTCMPLHLHVICGCSLTELHNCDRHYLAPHIYSGCSLALYRKSFPNLGLNWCCKY